MDTLINQLPAILEKSGSLFGIFALAAIILASVVFLLFRTSGTKQKERIFIYMTLFLLTLVFSALAAGIFSGFERGSEAVTTQVENDPSLIKLSASATQKLEQHLASQGAQATDSNKAQILEKALDNYLNPPATPAPLASPASSPTPASSTTSPVSTSASNQVVAEGFLFNLEGCKQASGSLECALLVTNKEDDNLLYIYGNSSRAVSRIVDSQGNQYIASRVEFGGYEGERYVGNKLVREVGVRARVKFEKVPAQVNQLALVEFSCQAETVYGNRFAAQFRNVAVSS